MELKNKIIKVYYGKDKKPYKDRECKIPYLFDNEEFQGSYNSTQIFINITNLSNGLSIVAKTKRPNGDVAQDLLTSTITDENGDTFYIHNLGSWYSAYQGNLVITYNIYNAIASIQNGEIVIEDNNWGVIATSVFRIPIIYAPYTMPNIDDKPDLVSQILMLLNQATNIVIDKTSYIITTREQLVQTTLNANKTLYLINFSGTDIDISKGLCLCFRSNYNNKESVNIISSGKSISVETLKPYNNITKFISLENGELIVEGKIVSNEIDTNKIKSPAFLNSNDENLETKINTNETNIADEITNRENADTTLQENIDKKINLTEKGSASGVAPLNANSKIDDVYLNITTNLLYSGEIDTSGVCTLNQAFIDKFGISSLTISANDSNNFDGAYFVLNGNELVLAQGNAGGSITYNLGDAVVSHGNKGYGKIDNSENVTSVNGKQGAVVLTPSDIGATSIEHFDYYLVQSGHDYSSMTAEEMWALPIKKLLINQYGEIMYVNQGSDLTEKSIYVIGLFERRQESQNAFFSSSEILFTRSFITPSYYSDSLSGTLEHQILSINYQDQEQDIFALTTTDYGICMVLTEETKTNESNQTILEYSIVANGILYQGVVNKDLNTFTLTQKPAKQAEQSTNGKALLDTDDLGKIIQLDFTGTLSGNVITFALTQQDLTLIENNTYEIDLHLHVSGVISDDATMVLNYNGNTINLSNIINNSGTMMVRDMRQLQKYNSDTGYRWIFQAVYNTANSQLFFGIPSTVVKQDIISLDNETFLDYITLGGLENGQLVVIDKIIAGSNGYLLGHTYKVVYDYQSDTYSTIDINENNIQITETAPTLATLVSGASYTCLNNISSLTISDISSATEETIIYFIASQDFYINVPDTSIIESEGLQCLSGVAYELHIKHNRLKLIGANDADTREIVYLDINNNISLYYDSFTIQNIHDCIYIINWSRALYTSQMRGIAFCGSIKNCHFEIHFKNNANLTDTNQYISLFSDNNRGYGMAISQLPSEGVIHSNDNYFYPIHTSLTMFDVMKKPYVSSTTDGTTTTKITTYFAFDFSKDGKALLNATYGYDKVVS